MGYNDPLIDRTQNFDGYPKAWQSVENSLIAGKLVKYDRGPTRDYGDKMIAVIEVDTFIGQDGRIHKPPAPVRRSIWFFHKALASQWAKARPKPGERVAVRRLQNRQNRVPGRKPYADYLVEVERDGGDSGYVPDFDRMLADTEEVPPEDPEDFVPEHYGANDHFDEGQREMRQTPPQDGGMPSRHVHQPPIDPEDDLPF